MKVRVLFVLAIGLLVALALTATATANTQLPQENFTKSADSGKEYTFGWRTALGALEVASQESCFNYSIKETSWGIFTDCVGGKCPVNQSGWMYWVNYPQESMPGVAAGQYPLEQGDVVTWYFGSMSDSPANSSYRINVAIGDGFSVGVNVTDPDGVNNTLEKTVSKYYDGFQWIGEKPSKSDDVNAVTNAVRQYFSADTPSKKQEIVNDVTQMVQLYFQLGS